eukprot:s1614_g14.t4
MVTQHHAMVMASKEQGQPEFLTSRTREVDGAAQVTQEHKQQLVNGSLDWCCEVHEQVVEVPDVQVQEIIQEIPEVQIVEKVVEVPRVLKQPVEHLVEEIIHVPKVVVHERIQHRTVEEWIDIPVPQPQEEIVHVPVKEYQDRHHHVEVEQFVDIPVPVQQEDVVQIPVELPQKRVIQQSVEQLVEVPVSITQEEIVHVPRVVYQHRHHHAEVEQVVDLHVPHHIEETVSVPKVIQQERLVHHTVEQLVEVPVQIPQEKIVQVPKIAVQERQNVVHVEHVIEIPVPQTVEEIVQVPIVQTEERLVQNPVEITVEVPRPVILEKTIEVPKVQIEETIVKVPKIMQTVQHLTIQDQLQKIEVVKPQIIQRTVRRKKPIIQENITEVPQITIEHVPVEKVVKKPVDVPQIQYVDKIVDVPVQKQRHVPVIQKVPKIVEVPTLEYVDHVVHVPITQHRHVPVVQTVKKHVEVPVVKYEDEILHVPVQKHVHVPMVTKVPRTVEVEQVEYVDHHVHIPVQTHRHVTVEKRMQRTVEVPQIEYVDKVVPVPVQKHVHVPQVAAVERHVEVPQIQYVDKDLEVPVPVHRHVPVLSKVSKPVEVPVKETIEKVIEVPVVNQVDIPQVQTVEKIVEVPVVQEVQKVVEVPVVGDTVPGQQQRSCVDLPVLRREAPPEVRMEVVQGPPMPPEYVKGLVTAAPSPAASHAASTLGGLATPPRTGSFMPPMMGSFAPPMGSGCLTPGSLWQANSAGTPTGSPGCTFSPKKSRHFLQNTILLATDVLSPGVRVHLFPETILFFLLTAAAPIRTIAVTFPWSIRHATGKTQQPGRHDNFGPGVATTRPGKLGISSPKGPKSGEQRERDGVTPPAASYRYGRDQLLLLQSSMELPSPPRMTNGRPKPAGELNALQQKFPVFGAMTKEHLVSEGVLPASTLEDKQVAGTLRGRAEGRGRGNKGRGKGGRMGRFRWASLQASPVQTTPGGSAVGSMMASLELPERDQRDRQVSGGGPAHELGLDGSDAIYGSKLGHLTLKQNWSYKLNLLTTSCSWLIAQLVSGPSLVIRSMGSVPFCDCSQLCTDHKEKKDPESPLEMERLQAARQLFELTDLNGDGLISVEEFALMGLLQTKEKKMTKVEEEQIRQIFVQRFGRDINSSFWPVPYAQYKEYIMWSVNSMDPGDLKAQSLIWDGLLVEAKIARQMATEDKALQVAPALPSLLTSLGQNCPSPKHVLYEKASGPRNPMSSFLARVLTKGPAPEQKVESAVAAAGLPPGTSLPPPAAAVPVQSPTVRPPVPEKPPPPPPGPGEAAEMAPAPQEVPVRPGPLPSSPPRHPPTMGATGLGALEMPPEPMPSPQRAPVNLATALAGAASASVASAQVLERELGLGLGESLMPPAPQPQALQPGRVTAPQRQAALRMEDQSVTARLQEDLEEFENGSCWYYKDPSGKVQAT